MPHEIRSGRQIVFHNHWERKCCTSSKIDRPATSKFNKQCVQQSNCENAQGEGFHGRNWGLHDILTREVATKTISECMWLLRVPDSIATQSIVQSIAIAAPSRFGDFLHNPCPRTDILRTLVALRSGPWRTAGCATFGA
jgi:hypothetical protein